MKKLLVGLGIAIMCVSIPTWHAAMGQQGPEGIDPDGRLSNRELAELVATQTAAIQNLNERLRALERRVETLEDGGNR